MIIKFKVNYPVWQYPVFVVFYLMAFGILYSQEDMYHFSTLAGAEKGWQDGTLKEARFRTPEGIAIDTSGNLYITEYWNNTVRIIGVDGRVTTLAGHPDEIGSTDGHGQDARFNRPHGLAVVADGTIFVCDMKNHTIRKIDIDGKVSTIAGKAGVTGTRDGKALESSFNQPEDVVVNSKGVLYVADSYNFTIREISLNGIVSTFAGMPGQPGATDGIGPKARFNMPIGIAVDGNDNLYVADSTYDGKENGNCTIRKITPDGQVSTIAGKPNIAGKVDGPGMEARFNRPVGIAVSKNGTIYIADTEADLIRKIDVHGNVTTLGGTYLMESFQDGKGGEAYFADPQAIAIDSEGTLYIADTFNHRIREGNPIK